MSLFLDLSWDYMLVFMCVSMRVNTSGCAACGCVRACMSVLACVRVKMIIFSNVNTENRVGSTVRITAKVLHKIHILICVLIMLKRERERERERARAREKA